MGTLTTSLGPCTKGLLDLAVTLAKFRIQTIITGPPIMTLITRAIMEITAPSMLLLGLFSK